MAEKSKINLLPIQFTEIQKEQKKFSRIQYISIGLILTLVFLSSVTLALRILQNQNVSAGQASLKLVSDQVADFKSTESSLVVLKLRLAAIDALSADPSKQRAIFNVVERLTPQSITISAMTLDKSGNISLSATTLSYEDIQLMIANLISKEKNEGKIAGVTLESLTRGRDGIFRVGMKVKSI